MSNTNLKNLRCLGVFTNKSKNIIEQKLFVGRNVDIKADPFRMSTDVIVDESDRPIPCQDIQMFPGKLEDKRWCRLLHKDFETTLPIPVPGRYYVTNLGVKLRCKLTTALYYVKSSILYGMYGSHNTFVDEGGCEFEFDNSLTNVGNHSIHISDNLEEQEVAKINKQVTVDVHDFQQDLEKLMKKHRVSLWSYDNGNICIDYRNGFGHREYTRVTKQHRK